jgi:hypothetical protein
MLYKRLVFMWVLLALLSASIGTAGVSAQAQQPPDVSDGPEAMPDDNISITEVVLSKLVYLPMVARQ